MGEPMNNEPLIEKLCESCVSRSPSECSACDNVIDQYKFGKLTKESLVRLVKDYEKAIREMEKHNG
jgi:hypothetical protein